MTTTPNPAIWDQLQLLAVSGVAGAFFRAVVAPEKEWKRRVVQAMAGALSALFLGGLVGHGVEALTNAGPYAYLSAGFVMGSGGEFAVKAVQDRILGGKK